ncbi:hypothetical protein E2320_016856 [Naja naja]|nr:hypothetical protein E2320_016856 [Naja naja]
MRECFTVLLCASLTGGKLKPLVTDKSAKAHSFKNLQPKDLSVTWKSKKNCMDD